MLSSRIVRRTTVAPRHAGRPPAASTVSKGGRTSSPAVIGREMRAALSATLRDVMLTAADAVEAGCPIRTGHLLSNFILSTGSPHSGVVGSPESVSYGAQDAGRARVLAYDVGRDGRIYLTNHVEYLRYQKPFVAQALASGANAAPPAQRDRAKAMVKAAWRGGA
jgi:hypothetical protein